MRRLQKRWIAAALGMSVWMSACSSSAPGSGLENEQEQQEERQGADREIVAENDQTQEAPRHISPQETVRTEPITVKPVPETLNMTHFDNRTFAAGFLPGQIRQDGNNVLITLTVYDYERFDQTAIEQLRAGDTLLIDEKECLITSLECPETGRIKINGGVAQGGHELILEKSGPFYEAEIGTGRVYYKLGEVTLQTDEKFVLNDHSDLNTPMKIYTAEELFEMQGHLSGSFTPYNTAVTVKNEKILSIYRKFLPEN